ncbi:MAG TPA: ADOP family duplicated permease [Acidobacteriota bacterium]|nr:ADOP family duplicated permease [Acidobacteriota bacterium]
MLKDVFFAFRMLRKSPVFTIAAILTLMLGIGANTAIFSVTYHVLGDLPYPDSDRLVKLYTPDLERGIRWNPSLPDLLDIRDQANGLEALEAFRYRGALVDGDPESRASVVHSTSGFLNLLGAQAQKGRLFSREDWDAESPPAAVLSYQFWVSRYGGDDEAIGEVIRLNDTPYTIVGVAEPITGPLLRRHDVFIPWLIEQDRQRTSRGLRGGINAMGKLEQDVSLAQAQAELDVIGEELRRQYPQTSGKLAPEYVSLYEEVVGEAQPTLLALTGASVLILLIAVANIANLMLARGSRRQAELAIRSALGAGRLRLARLLLSEALLLSLVGGGAGLVAAWFLINAFVGNSPIHVPRLEEVGVDTQVILTSLTVSILSGLLFGLAPLLFLNNASGPQGLKDGGRQAGSKGLRSQSALAVVQVALSLILLTGSGLMVRSFMALQGVPLGIDFRQIVVLGSGSLRVGNFSDRPQRLQTVNRILENIQAAPGVESATVTSQAPLTGGWGANDVTVLTGPRRGASASPDLVGVAPNFFEFFTSTAQQGRTFTAQDGDFADSMVVADAKLAEQLWPGQSAVGQKLSFAENEAEVIGVVEPIRYGDLAEEIRPKLYTLLQHSSSAFGDTFLVRHRGDPEPIIEMLRNRVKEVDPTYRISQLQPLQAFYEKWLVKPRFYLLLLGGLGLLALAVAVVGVYGIMAYSVNRRISEIGIRMALGARRSNIFKLFYRRTALHLALGLTLGLLGALWLTRYLEALLFQTEPTDLVALVSTAALLAAAATMAVLLPVRRAVRINPARTLRDEG